MRHTLINRDLRVSFFYDRYLTQFHQNICHNSTVCGMVVFVHRKSSNEISREGKKKQMIFLISIMSFANFVFYPLVIGCIIAFIIESIFRAQDKAPQVLRSMAVRKYFWRQAWLFNIIWFVGYFILLIVNRPGAQQMPDMIWQG